MVLTKEFSTFHDRGVFCNEQIDPLMGNLFALSGKKWRNLRVKLTPTFTSGKIKQMFTVLKESSDELTKYLEVKAQMKDSIDIKDIFARYTTDVIMTTAFGVKSNCIEEPNNEYRSMGKKIFDINSIWIALFMFAPQILEFFSISLTPREVSSFYMNMFRENVEYRDKHNVVRHDFMNLLIQLMKKGYVESDGDKNGIDEPSTVSKLTMTEATAQSYVFFAAGFETSSTTATFALYELAQHHDIQDKVREEIDESLTKHGELTYDAINEMTYLHKVINETLRKYPPLPLLNRICTKDVYLPIVNVHLPKGTAITIPVYGLHHDPLIYPDPEKFDPERFNTDAVKKRHPYAYMPFGEGPRICIGARFGYVQTKVGLVNLLSKYKFDLDPRTHVPIVFKESSGVLAAKGGVHLIIKPR
ncbi:hypothetical protein PUN28_019105 [Cardiocondyla obscurior]